MGDKLSEAGLSGPAGNLAGSPEDGICPVLGTPAVRLALFWTRAKDAARDFYHVRNPGVWKTLGMLF
jgi:hypothetical protein